LKGLGHRRNQRDDRSPEQLHRQGLRQSEPLLDIAPDVGLLDDLADLPVETVVGLVPGDALHQLFEEALGRRRRVGPVVAGVQTGR
jgi:hypothetical protein